MTNLKSRRDSLANEYFRRARRRFDITYCNGFDAAIAELRPEIDKLVKALESVRLECGATSIRSWTETRKRIGDKVLEALTKYKEVMGDRE